MFRSQPIVELAIHSYHLDYEIYVNGHLIAIEMKDRPQEWTRPLNELIRHGENELVVVIFPQYEKGVPESEFDFRSTSDLLLSLKVRPYLMKEEDNRPTFATLAFSGKQDPWKRGWQGSSPDGRFDSTHGFAQSEQGDVHISTIENKPIELNRYRVVLHRKFTIPYPHPQWAFFNSDVFAEWATEHSEHNNVVYEELMDEYRKLEKILRGQRLRCLCPRSREIDQAYYKQPGETAKALKASFVRALDNPKRKLKGIESKKQWFHPVGPGGRVSWIVRSALTNTPLLSIPYATDPSFATNVPAVFRKQNGKYILTR